VRRRGKRDEREKWSRGGEEIRRVRALSDEEEMERKKMKVIW
jgi:hypothetical protein